MTQERVLHTAGLEKTYGRRRVLDSVDLEVFRGEVVGITGENGTGKSTLIEILMGFKAVDGGEALVLGEEPRSRRHLARVGWMPEQPAFPPRWRVREILAFQRATQPRWDEDLARELEDRLVLDRSLRGGELSRGQRGRLALLLALAHRPDLLLLDDPTLGLDAPTRRMVVGELLAAVAQEGAAVLLTTHRLAEIARTLDRVLLLAGGRMVSERSIEDLRGAAIGSGESLEEALFGLGGAA